MEAPRLARQVNDTIGRIGTLWQGRYRSSLVASERYVMACHRYIELNPVRAGMVAEPADYPWSSYGCNGLGRHDPVVSAHELCQRIAQNAARRELVSQVLADDDIAAIRQYIKRQRALGPSGFQVQIEQQLQRRAGLERPGRPAKEKVL